MPPTYVLASLAVSLGGLLNGYDTGAIGAITSMPQFRSSLGPLTAARLGLTVSAIMLAGAAPSLLAGHLADAFGRLRVIAAGAVLFALGAAMQGAAPALGVFVAGRVVAGLGEGVFLSNIAVYVCEIAPARQRGALAALPQFMTTVGICAGYFTCYASVRAEGDWAWRAPYLVQGALAAVFAAACLGLPDSPRWLLLQGRRTEALEAARRLQLVDLLEVERDGLAPNAEQRSGLSPWQGFLLLFRRGYRARTILALFILGMVQLSGIDAVIYYAPVLFEQAGLSSSNASFLASGVSAILMLVVSIPAFLLADKWGRRTSAISGGILLSGCMFLMGSLYAAGAVHAGGIARWFVIVAVFVFGLTYCVTWGVVGKIYASEIQPGHTRAAANCVAQGLSFFTNWLVAYLAPILLEASSFGAYFLFGGLALGTVAVLAACMPETRGRSLEDIQAAFHQPAPALSNVAQYLRPLTLGRRRRAQHGVPATEDATEMDNRDTAGSAAASAVSVDNVTRSLRLEVSA
ncbi:putative MFS sugar transporter [Xylariomycetidae sp. FL0641]|nr:putative MFS sugar transporter [Xylariomycetidae sp. FL0641]